MRRYRERTSPGSGVRPARGPLLTFWLPMMLLFAQGVGVVALVGWLISSAEDTKSRRALRVPYAIAAFDLAKPITDTEFEAYRSEAEGLQTATAAPPAVDAQFQDVRFDDIPPAPPGMKNGLRPPPVDSNLMEVSPFGPLPVVSSDGRASWQVYSQPVDAKKVSAAKGAIAIIVENAGLSEPALASFLADLPPSVTFAFNPYAPELDHWIGRTRALGHEVLMGLPMEPKNFPQSDPGPRALMKDYTAARNIEAMKWSLGRGAGYVGLLTIMGDSFTETAWRINPVLREVKKRGLLFVDTSTEAGRTVTRERARALGLPYAPAAFRIGDDIGQQAIQGIFRKTEDAARKNGQAVLVVSPYPVVLALLQQWLPMLEAKKVVLIPVSHVATTTMKRWEKE